MTEQVYVGLALMSHDPSRSAQAHISHVTTTGNISPADFFTESQNISLQLPPISHEQRSSQ